ncbi:hypothetical protein [Chelativorans sp. M5D2P16]|uniref:hypothetical protein n=1 Tax=Chelativorans sp. M5D2P16 TaxID=3095678 RepID=UPI002ACA4494|nr:hypothetical protein [Chelativorans sp. M5D2P16]MDZ5698817.1 hypothetical protein [Chelativorans sp. M5D2P16]
MGHSFSSRHCLAATLLLGVAILGGCQQGPSSTQNTLNPTQAGAEPVRESELRAYCPAVTLRDGTNYFRTYERGGEGDPDRIVYQASIADTSRACKYGADATTMTVAVAGKIVPGPKGRTGAVDMPIRVAAVRGDEVLYSNLFRHSVTVGDTAGATQFVFTTADVVIPGGVDPAVQLFVGFDEGPQGGR